MTLSLSGRPLRGSLAYQKGERSTKRIRSPETFLTPPMSTAQTAPASDPARARSLSRVLTSPILWATARSSPPVPCPQLGRLYLYEDGSKILCGGCDKLDGLRFGVYGDLEEPFSRLVVFLGQKTSRQRILSHFGRIVCRASEYVAQGAAR